MRLLICDIFIVLLVESSRALSFLFLFSFAYNARQNIESKYYAT